MCVVCVCMVCVHGWALGGLQHSQEDNFNLITFKNITVYWVNAMLHCKYNCRCVWGGGVYEAIFMPTLTSHHWVRSVVSPACRTYPRNNISRTISRCPVSSYTRNHGIMNSLCVLQSKILQHWQVSSGWVSTSAKRQTSHYRESIVSQHSYSSKSI